MLGNTPGKTYRAPLSFHINLSDRRQEPFNGKITNNFFFSNYTVVIILLMQATDLNIPSSPDLTMKVSDFFGTAIYFKQVPLFATLCSEPMPQICKPGNSVGSFPSQYFYQAFSFSHKATFLKF